MLLFYSPLGLITRFDLTLNSYKAATHSETFFLHQYRLASRCDTGNTRNAKKFTRHDLSGLSLLHFDSAWYLTERVDWSVGFPCESASRDTALRRHRVIPHNHGTVFEEWLDCFWCRRLCLLWFHWRFQT